MNVRARALFANFCCSVCSTEIVATSYIPETAASRIALRRLPMDARVCVRGSYRFKSLLCAQA